MIVNKASSNCVHSESDGIEAGAGVGTATLTVRLSPVHVQVIDAPAVNPSVEIVLFCQVDVDELIVPDVVPLGT